MYKLSWARGFRRAFKKVTRKNSRLEEKLFLTLEKLLDKPFPQNSKHTNYMVNYKDSGPVKSNTIAVLFLPLKIPLD